MIQNKITRTVDHEILEIPFQRGLFFQLILVSIVFLGVGFAIYFYTPLSLMGVLIIFFIYIIPTVIAFDTFSSFQEKFDVPKLIHPKRWIILLLNLIFGWTIILWFVVLYIACSPGNVSATIVKYDKIK